LKFFIIDENVFDSEGYLIAKLSASATGPWIEGSSEICIIPNPGNRWQYYIFTNTRHAGNFPNGYYTILDLSLQSQVFGNKPERKGALL
jgi:hypothetical protein